LAQKLDEQVNRVPDDQVPDQLRAAVAQQRGSQLRALAAELTDETLRARLEQAARAPSYSELMTQLEALASEVGEQDPQLARSLWAIRGTDPEDFRIPVSFILATDPSTEYEGRVKEVHLSAQVRDEEGNTVLIKVEIDKEDLENHGVRLRPGATVNAKVYCGKRSIGFVWFHDLIAFIRSRILFRL